ncbi:hypothetical protein ASPSYDRAFT_25800 [Aspergillus sydowii CBS 593.65]|uniref:Uncharacterized protein n=1 Tax=Aspergillus sydowii CBS 593.65 TaxID=1036612 RepID=A0A1L9TWI2_9EURO|nr:uncharacterized protein ASPSYDRAFT_25800 [Aspergillus sydowii CBS 593.65]OJJ63752.1 hypothetical protein ASPSYDRAFT_25800 [Aspergillus sydowii CBS 593.65]
MAFCSLLFLWSASRLEININSPESGPANQRYQVHERGCSASKQASDSPVMVEVPEFVPHLNNDDIWLALPGIMGQGRLLKLLHLAWHDHNSLPLGGWNLPVPFSVGNCYLSLRYPDCNCIVDDHGQPIVQPAAASFFPLSTPCFLSILNLEMSGDQKPQACENVLSASKGENWQLPRSGCRLGLMKDGEICAEIAHYSIISEAHERKLGGRTVWRHDSDHSSSAAMSPTSPDLKDWNANREAKDLVFLIGAFVFFTIQKTTTFVWIAALSPPRGNGRRDTPPLRSEIN